MSDELKVQENSVPEDQKIQESESDVLDTSYECEKGCGFKGNYDEVSNHEKTCNWNKEVSN